MGEDRGRELRGSDVRWSAGEIHLPQSLNEEASANEFSEWEQVSSMAAELFAPTQLSPPVLSHTSPSPFYPPYPPFSKHGHCEPSPFCDIIESKRIC